MLAFKYVMYKMPVQMHKAVSSKMYHLKRTQIIGNASEAYTKFKKVNL